MRGLILYSEDRDAFMVLNVEQRGMLLTSLFDSSVGVEPKFNDDMVKALWLLLWPKQIRNNNNYEAECEKKRNMAVRNSPAFSYPLPVLVRVLSNLLIVK